jgi:DDE family transposase
VGAYYYWLLHELRSAAPKRSIWRTATFETIRCTFLKIAVRNQELKTRIKMALPSTYPNVQALTALATSIAANVLEHPPPFNPADVMRSHRQSPAPTNNWG